MQPFVGLGFALEALDGPDLGAGTWGFDLPVVLGHSLIFKNDSDARCFAHGATMPMFGLGG